MPTEFMPGCRSREQVVEPFCSVKKPVTGAPKRRSASPKKPLLTAGSR